MSKTHGHAGYYINLEGIVGSGKGTAIEGIKPRLASEFPAVEFVFTREPGGTPYAESLRTRVKHEKLPAILEAQFFLDARSEPHMGTLPVIVRSALVRGGCVFTDRSFFSSLAYQGGGRGLGVKNVWEYNRPFVRSFIPDLVIWQNIPPEVGVERSIGASDSDKFDREKIAFFRRVIKGYEEGIRLVKKEFPEMKVYVIDDKDGSIGKEEMIELVWEVVKENVKDWIQDKEIREGKLLKETALSPGKERI